RFQIATATNRDWWLRRIKICHSAVFISTSALTNRTRLYARPDPPCGRLTNRTFHADTIRISRTLPAIRKRDSDLEAQDLYSKFYRYKLEMFNFPNHPCKFGIYQMQSFFR